MKCLRVKYTGTNQLSMGAAPSGLQPTEVIIMLPTRMALLLAAATSVPTASATALLAFGDSWAWLGYDQLRDVFGSHGIDTALEAIPGTPAAYWADIEPHALVNAVDKANASHVYLSIGGNEFLEGLPLKINILEIYAEMMRATGKIIDTLVAARPHVHVYHFGYEILNWEGSAYCRGFGDLELKGDPPLFCPDSTNVTCMTHIQATWLQANFVDLLARKYSSNPHYHGLNLLGTLQVAGGVPGAEVGAPNWGRYSPAQYVRSEAKLDWGCVHLTPDGYTALYTELAKHVQVVVDAEGGAADTRERERAAVAAVAVPNPSLAARTVRPIKTESVGVHAERRACVATPERECTRVASTKKVAHIALDDASGDACLWAEDELVITKDIHFGSAFNNATGRMQRIP